MAARLETQFARSGLSNPVKPSSTNPVTTLYRAVVMDQ